MKRETRKILGVKVDYGMSKEDVLSEIETYIDSEKSHYICTVNPEFVMDSQKDRDFQNAINESDLSVPDGSGLLYAKFYQDKLKDLPEDLLFPIRAFLIGVWYGFSSLFKVYDLGEKISGSDLVYDSCGLASEKGYTVFFLGGWIRDGLGRHSSENGYIAERTADEFRKIFPDIKIIGAISEYTYKEEDDIETLNTIRDCMLKSNVTHIDIIFVAYGHKKQERWMRRNIEKIPARVGIGMGASFDYVIGTQKRAPRKYIRKNLEWIYRLFTQPWRIRRIAKAFPIFPLSVFLYSVKELMKK